MPKCLVGVLTHNPPDPTSLWFSPISGCCSSILLLSGGTVSGPQRVFLIQALKGCSRSKVRFILCPSKLLKFSVFVEYKSNGGSELVTVFKSGHPESSIAADSKPLRASLVPVWQP